MDPLLAAALGLVAGVLATAAACRWWPRARAEESTTPGSVPEGVKHVLAVLRSGAIVLDASDAVVSASQSAVAHGLVKGSDLTHSELRHLARAVRRDGVIREVEMDLPRGPLGQSRVFIGARVASVGHGHVLILVDDRTLARRVEEIRRDFVVNVSHELKTPVGGLALLAEAVQDAADDPVAVTRFASRMRTETERLTRLVSEIVELSRLQVADTLKEPVLVQLDQCAQEAVDHATTIADAREIELVTVASDDPARLRVYGEPELLTTAIRNLVMNAIAYSEAGSRTTITTRRNGDLVEVAVADQGKGIAPEDQERIFERFYRVDAARSRQTGGTGLGLAIVKHISNNHGGDVTLWSVEGRGSTFTLRIPAAGHGSAQTEPAHLSLVATSDDAELLAPNRSTERQTT